jgi:disulfide bond formation protein DsbB
VTGWYRRICFVLGIVILLAGVLGPVPQWADILVGLLLLGVLSGEQLVALARPAKRHKGADD